MGQMGIPIFAAAQVNSFPKIKEYLPIYREARAAAGHPDHGGEDVTILLPTYVANTPAQVRQEMEPSIMRWLQSAAARYTSRLHPAMQDATEPYALLPSLTR